MNWVRSTESCKDVIKEIKDALGTGDVVAIDTEFLGLPKYNAGVENFIKNDSVLNKLKTLNGRAADTEIIKGYINTSIYGVAQIGITVWNGTLGRKSRMKSIGIYIDPLNYMNPKDIRIGSECVRFLEGNEFQFSELFEKGVSSRKYSMLEGVQVVECGSAFFDILYDPEYNIDEFNIAMGLATMAHTWMETECSVDIDLTNKEEHDGDETYGRTPYIEKGEYISGCSIKDGDLHMRIRNPRVLYLFSRIIRWAVLGMEFVASDEVDVVLRKAWDGKSADEVVALEGTGYDVLESDLERVGRAIKDGIKKKDVVVHNGIIDLVYIAKINNVDSGDTIEELERFGEEGRLSRYKKYIDEFYGIFENVYDTKYIANDTTRNIFGIQIGSENTSLEHLLHSTERELGIKSRPYKLHDARDDSLITMKVFFYMCNMMNMEIGKDYEHFKRMKEDITYFGAVSGCLYIYN